MGGASQIDPDGLFVAQRGYDRRFFNEQARCQERDYQDSGQQRDVVGVPPVLVPPILDVLQRAADEPVPAPPFLSAAALDPDAKFHLLGRNLRVGVEMKYVIYQISVWMEGGAL